ncbi:GNAT family N-acetyltransferase [Amycolatopsis sp. FDAARGOS 1241]|uniref:GNAT family N-acetyltransferase n=1 Tax=Amycolatopsis sp. FDAARGOS 1241 TaxID=2778070 RepID=UPI001951BC66|nr:GNAT family N-acetyltransferase [Amycolatopsis sp. FDAARGOS 1241]QRP49833.1 GNAT family N-acetyltransferase [Amycolatopsis sp. FDAARGOS 1241]
MDHLITPVTADRIPDLVSSVEALFREDGGRRDPTMDLTWPRREGAAYYTELLRDEDALCLLASRGAVTGHLIGRVRRRDPLRPGVVTAALESMRVAREMRRSGVGTALVAAFASWAGEKGADHCEVTAYSTNATALAFYRRHGFTDFELTLRR